MNTVLDENKMLCLSNGQRIKLNSDIKIIFELDDVKNSTPASITRCGILFLDSEILGIRFLFTKWIN